MKRIDEFHYHEAIDRAHCINMMLEELLIAHPAVEENKEICDKLNKAADLIGNAYQMLGSKSMELFDKEK